MHKPVSLMALLLALGLFAVAPVAAPAGPFAAVPAFADDDGGGDDGGDSDDGGRDDAGGHDDDDDDGMQGKDRKESGKAKAKHRKKVKAGRGGD